MITIVCDTDYRTRAEGYLEPYPELAGDCQWAEPGEFLAPGTATVQVDASGIRFSPEWFDRFPPFVLPQNRPFDRESFPGWLHLRLLVADQVPHLLETVPALGETWACIQALVGGEPIPDPFLQEESTDPFENYGRLHNRALMLHYEVLTPALDDLDQLLTLYHRAWEAAPNEEYQAFTARQMGVLLLDIGQEAAAAQWITQHLPLVLSQEGEFALKNLLVNAWSQAMPFPFEEPFMTRLKDTLWETLEFMEEGGFHSETGMLLVQAAQIANLSHSFAESLGYINRAISLFESDDWEELTADAQAKKGSILFNWAQQGQPQFYKPAIEAYQEALKFFRKEIAPAIFAEIQHNLGVIYAEMPSDERKKSLLAAISASSFQEALSFFTKEAHPHEYAMICNSYANALIRYPEARIGNNIEKALDYYREALSVRTQDMPRERAMTLLNFLEASWLAPNPEGANQERLADMYEKAREVKSLVQDPAFIQEADRHLEQLDALALVLNNE